MARRRQSLANTVEVGNDGFLFHRSERTFDQVCGQILLKGRPLERWISLLESRHAWCGARGIRHVFFVTPEKHVVYRDKIPSHAISEDRPVEAIRRGMSTNARADFVYPLRELVEARASRDTFFRTDVHWSAWGAYVGYRALVQAISRTHRIDPIPESALSSSTGRMVGDLGIRLDEEPDEEVIHLEADTPEYVKVFGNQAFSAGQVEVYESDGDAKPRAILFRDSNATAMLPLLAPHFSRLTVVATHTFYHELVRSERPDLVIMQTTERQLARPETVGTSEPLIFPRDFDEAGFVEFTRMTLPLAERRHVIVTDFREGGNSASRRGVGWSHQEKDGVWMTDRESTVTLPLSCEPGRGDFHLELDAIPIVMEPMAPRQRVRLAANGVLLGERELNSPGTLTYRIPAEAASGERLELTFEHPDAIAPEIDGRSRDIRKLSFRVSELRLRPVDPAPQ
jgi:hypothetical protein